jgi:hypothetical protein
MIWNNDTQSYRGITADSKVVDVAGDEYQEALEDGILALSGEDDIDAIPAADVEKYAMEVYKEIDDPNMWATFVGENQNVEYVQ